MHQIRSALAARRSIALAALLTLAACGGDDEATFTIGGAVSGLAGTVTLQNRGESLTLAADGGFTFSDTVAAGAAYDILVAVPPANQHCTVTNGAGTVGGADVTDVTVVCAPGRPVLTLAPQAVKTFRFDWEDVTDETEYRLLEDADGSSGYAPIATIGADSESYAHAVFLPARINARYVLQACHPGGCVDSAPVHVSGTLSAAAGYIKASNPGTDDRFGDSVALSADGRTLAVGAPWERSNATGINGDENNDAAPFSGAVYVYTQDAGVWIQEAYVKASNTGEGGPFGVWWGAQFGASVALSADGNTLVVGAPWESSAATGINGDQGNDSAGLSGAAYVFTRTGTTWAQQAYVKASNTGINDEFGSSVALSADGLTLAVGAIGEMSDATGINQDEDNDSALGSGAVYVYAHNGDTWAQQAYIKASNTRIFVGFGFTFGAAVALSTDGNTLAVGAPHEHSGATGINDDQDNVAMPLSGAVYVYTRHADAWAQQAYIKASNTGQIDEFGVSVALSADGNTLAVGAHGEDSSATGIDGDAGDDPAASESGAVYVYVRSGGTWLQQAYIKASNTGLTDNFGIGIALSADGDTLVVGAPGEDSNATGIGGDEGSDEVSASGAAYVYARGGDAWIHKAYIKASNVGRLHEFGSNVALSADGGTLAIGAPREDSNPFAVVGSGAVYLY